MKGTTHIFLAWGQVGRLYSQLVPQLFRATLGTPYRGGVTTVTYLHQYTEYWGFPHGFGYRKVVLQPNESTKPCC